MNVIALLMMLWLAVFSSTGPVQEPGVGVEPPVPSSTTSPGADVPAEGPPGEVAIEQRFLTRSPIPVCGYVQASSGSDPRLTDPASFDCLRKAVEAGEGAELVGVVSDDRGTSVSTYLRVAPDGPLEVYVDRRASSRGPSWSYERCPVPATFTLDGCP